MLSDLKSYEISFLLKNPEGESAIVDLINQHKGKIIHKGSLKEIKLAFPIKKHSSAYFGYVQFELAPAQIEKVSQSLKLNPLVLRHLTITPPMIKKERRIESREREYVKPAAPQSVLTNEALEEKLEEILK